MKYSFKELVDVPKLQDLTDEMYAAFSIPCSIIAVDGEILTGVGWQKICTDFHRKHPLAEKECVESDVKIRKRLDQGEPFVIYKCPRGLVDASSPVIIAGEHLANVFSGQIFLQEPDEDTERFFREQARRFGFDEAPYMEAFREIPVFDEDKFRSALFFLSKMAGIIADAGLAGLEVLEVADALRESEERYRLLADHATDMISKHDSEGVYTYASPACRTLLGFSPADLTGRSACDLIHPDDKRAVRKTHDRTLGRREPTTITYRLKDKEGRFVWVETKSKAIRIPNTNEVESIIAITRNVTDRKLEENRLRSAYAKLKALWSIRTLEGADENEISEHVLSSVIEMTESEYGFYGVLTDDQSAMVIHSWTSKAMEECAVKDRPLRFPIDEAGIWAEAVRTRRPLVLNDYAASHEAKKGLPEGHVPISNLLVVPVLQKGKVKLVAAAANKPAGYQQEDIDQVESFLFSIQALVESHKAEQALRESERRLQSILDYSPARIFLKDLEGRYILVNRQCETSLGLTYDDLVGKTLYDLFPERLADHFAANDRKVLETGAALEVEEVIPGNNGDCTFLTVMFPLLDADGKPYAIGGVSTDITLRKKAQEERMESRERLARTRRMEALGTLAGGVAHEFNNLLGVVLGNVELAMEDFPGDHPAMKYLVDAKTASLRGADVVKQILRFMRKVPGEKHPVSVAPVVRETLKLMRVAIPKNIEIRTDILCDEETILGTPGDLGQVVVNLCSNASHAMGEAGGSLTVELESAYLHDPSVLGHERLGPGRYVKLVVKDDGAGIEPEIMDRIFEPYFTTKEIDQGLGMGLSVVYGIVKDYEGSIKVESRVAEGTSVEILLPAQWGREVSTVREDTDLKGGRERILFVDDEESLAKTGKRMLERLGYSVVAKTDSLEALALFEARPDDFDLVITDLAMPSITGDCLGRKIRKLRPDMPMILCTGHSDRIDEASARACGFRAFVMKPLAKMVLARTVSDVLIQAKALADR